MHKIVWGKTTINILSVTLFHPRCRYTSAYLLKEIQNEIAGKLFYEMSNEYRALDLIMKFKIMGHCAALEYNDRI